MSLGRAGIFPEGQTPDNIWVYTLSPFISFICCGDFSFECNLRFLLKFH